MTVLLEQMGTTNIGLDERNRSVVVHNISQPAEVASRRRLQEVGAKPYQPT